MLQISLFIESDSEQEASAIINEVLPELAELVSTYQVSSCEQYWKIETWYKAVIDVTTVNPITLIVQIICSRDYVTFGYGTTINHQLTQMIGTTMLSMYIPKSDLLIVGLRI
ncbi:MAG TPA: hypothetical protein DCK78_08025 [Paenibacillus lactis]|nr:hypothetical protein [Paenibacillus lactis]